MASHRRPGLTIQRCGDFISNRKSIREFTVSVTAPDDSINLRHFRQLQLNPATTLLRLECVDDLQNRVAALDRSVIDALVRAAGRGVLINVLLERSEAEGGNVTTDSLGLIRAKIPGARFFEWDQDVSGSQFAGASVHAKCAVADGREAFVTSANLTGAAMEKNMEAGVMIGGGPLPAQLENHLLALVTTKHLKRVGG
jgi:hypothetical protein